MFRTLLLSAAALVAATFLAFGAGERPAEAGPTITATQGCIKDLFAPFDGKMDCFASHPYGVKHVQLVLPSNGPISVALHGQHYNCEPVVYFSVVDVGDPHLGQYIETTPCPPRSRVDDYKAPDLEPERLIQLQLIVM